jgi:hypothetical protein
VKGRRRWWPQQRGKRNGKEGGREEEEGEGEGENRPTTAARWKPEGLQMPECQTNPSPVKARRGPPRSSARASLRNARRR